eukprot:scaffold71090_cov17-Tisochrysis_lutea.AAC.2
MLVSCPWLSAFCCPAKKPFSKGSSCLAIWNSMLGLALHDRIKFCFCVCSVAHSESLPQPEGALAQRKGTRRKKREKECRPMQTQEYKDEKDACGNGAPLRLHFIEFIAWCTSFACRKPTPTPPPPAGARRKRWCILGARWLSLCA